MIEKNIEINGIKTFTRIAGQGSPFLILHGWGASTESWKKVQKKLSEKFQVFVLDFPGFGRSDLPPVAWDVQDYVRFVLDFAKEMGLEKFCLLGHSFGGRVAIKLAAQFPQKIEKLILVDTAGVKVKKTFTKKLLVFLAPFSGVFRVIPGFQIGRKVFYKFILRKTDYLKATGVMKETFKKVIDEDITPFFGKITVPTFIVWGEKDKITPLRDAYLMKAKIRDSELKIFDCGHCPHYEAPNLLAKTILDFVKK